MPPPLGECGPLTPLFLIITFAIINVACDVEVLDPSLLEFAGGSGSAESRRLVRILENPSPYRQLMQLHVSLILFEFTVLMSAVFSTKFLNYLCMLNV